IALLGQTPLAVRAAAALWGIATIPAMALLGGALGGRRLALAVAAIVALSYWPLHLSRVGLRPVALPSLEAAGVALLFFATAPTSFPLPLGEGRGEGVSGGAGSLGAATSRPGLRPHPGLLPEGEGTSSRRLLAIGAGVALGLQLYTYLPARLTLVVALL